MHKKQIKISSALLTIMFLLVGVGVTAEQDKLFSLTQTGNSQMQEGKYLEAITTFEQIIKDYPKHGLSAISQYKIGRCYFMLKKSTEALNSYQKVLTDYTNFQPKEMVLISIADCQITMNKYKDAINTYYEVLQSTSAQRPDLIHYYIAQCYTVLNDKTNATKEYQVIVDKYPQSIFCETAMKYAGIK